MTAFQLKFTHLLSQKLFFLFNLYLKNLNLLNYYPNNLYFVFYIFFIFHLLLVFILLIAATPTFTVFKIH